MVKLYTKNGCQRCRLTKREMDKLGVDYEAVNISENPAEAEHLIGMGFREMPVVDPTGDDDYASMWTGFRPDRIKNLAGNPAKS